MGARGGTGGGGGGDQGLQLVQNNLITVTPAKEVIEYTASPVCTRILRIVLATSTAVYRFLRLQALLYAILPSTTAVFIYVVGSRKLSASEQFFVGAQTEVTLLQTTQIISDVCFMLLTPAQINPKSFESRRNSFLFLPGVDAPHVYVRAWALACFHSLISTRTFRSALTASVDSCAEIKSTPSVA